MSKYYVNQWPVQSLSGRLDEDGNPVAYKVSEAVDGHFECSCKAWIFQRSHLLDGRRAEEWETPNGRCKHIVFIIQNRSGMADAIARGGSARFTGEDSSIEIKDGRILGFLEKLGVQKR